MPPAHQNYLEWTPSRIVSWAKKTGPATAELVQRIIDSRTHPEQAYRSCLGILRLEKHYSGQRLENACLRALKFSALSFQALRNILENGLDRLEQNPDSSKPALPDHENIRGSGYYH
jgi:transposase